MSMKEDESSAPNFAPRWTDMIHFDAKRHVRLLNSEPVQEYVRPACSRPIIG
jgi:hypothetical protein